ncbi:Variant surface glycoprotein [Trypanosoma congolense IL3000]|uniref:Variant surface glycoprotein n=1 Tax=Trypanosoma congolense (strain IL3000) TaxID=1068625 RepID=F9WJ11_TRYCI|nr:Variant surface glycoprotein [Trypanosoma congolense IL3000]
MACLINEIAIVILILLGFVSGQLEVAKDDNIEPFSLLCRIYNVAKNPPINYVDLHEPVEIVEEIHELNKSLLEEKGHNEEEDAGNNSEAQVKPTVTREATLAQLSLNQISQRAHTILDEIKKANITEETGKVKAEFNKVIFGDGGNESELEQTSLNGISDRAAACGKPGQDAKGEIAGKNLVVDFFCLCAQRPDGAGANQVCGFYMGSNRENGQVGWSETGPKGSSTMWSSIKGGCGKHMQQHPKSTAEARHILDQFLKHLRTGGIHREIDSSGNKVEGSERVEGMLGIGVKKKNGGSGNRPDCNGKKGGKSQSPGGVCVYYGAKSQWESIPWLKPFNTALASVDTVNAQTTTIQRSIQKLQMLLHRAEEIYETAKVITEVQNPVGLTTLQNATGNLTVYSATRIRSYSYNPNSYLIPLWVLLLL